MSDTLPPPSYTRVRSGATSGLQSPGKRQVSKKKTPRPAPPLGSPLKVPLALPLLPRQCDAPPSYRRTRSSAVTADCESRNDKPVNKKLRKKKLCSVDDEAPLSQYSILPKRKRPLTPVKPPPPPPPKIPKNVDIIMKEHRRMIRVDQQAFKAVRFVDEIWSIKKAKLEKMSVCFEAAKDRQVRLRKELIKWKPKSKKQKQLHLTVRQFETTMFIHFPSQFISNPSIKLKSRAKRLKKASRMSSQQKRRKIKELQVPSDGTLNKEKAAFENAIMYGMKANSKNQQKIEDVDPFFDKALKALTTKQIRLLYDANRSIVERGYQIKDYDGSPEDIERSLGHLPPGFWPPQLVDDLQAWRHAERELMYEKTILLKQESQKFFSADNVESLLGAIADVTDVLGGTSKGIAKGFSRKESIAIKSALGASQLYVKAIAPYKHAVIENGGSSKEALKALSKEHLVNLIAEMSNFASSLESVVSLGKMTPAAATFVELCPVLGAVGAGIETAVLAKQASAICKKRQIAIDELKSLKEMNRTFCKKTDLALANALGNETNARDFQLAKKVVETAAKGVATTGSIAGAAGGSGTALSVVGKCIALGNTVVFSGVDWKKAKKAMKTLERARAGSTKAQVTIFRDSAVYAKMYIAIQAKKGDPFAVSFIEQRGLTQDDLSQPMSLRLVRQALMADADQQDESVRTNCVSNVATDLLGEGTVNTFKKGKKKIKSQWNKRKAGKKKTKLK